MGWYREREPAQVSLFPLPSRFPAMRRVHCRCGCGCWFYAPRTPGRPPAYVSKRHALDDRNRRRKEIA